MVKRYEEKKPGNALKTAQEWFEDTARRSLGMRMVKICNERNPRKAQSGR
jgi:hypothetical protein